MGPGADESHALGVDGMRRDVISEEGYFLFLSVWRGVCVVFFILFIFHLYVLFLLSFDLCVCCVFFIYFCYFLCVRLSVCVLAHVRQCFLSLFHFSSSSVSGVSPYF